MAHLGIALPLVDTWLQWEVLHMNESLEGHNNLSRNLQSSYYQHPRRVQESCNNPKNKNRGREGVQTGSGYGVRAAADDGPCP